MNIRESKVRWIVTIAAAVLLAALLAGSARADQVTSDWDAAKVAQSCTGGGQVLRVSAFGSGYTVRVLVGSRVKTVRIDRDGNCH